MKPDKIWHHAAFHLGLHCLPKYLFLVSRMIEVKIYYKILALIFFHATQLSMKFFLLINVKMPTIVGILTFISMINTTFERLKARNFFICPYFSFYKQLKCGAQLS